MKKVLKLAIPVLLILAAFAAYYIDAGSSYEYTDIYGSWAAPQIDRWSDRGVLTGKDGRFRPDDGLTLAEFAVVMTRILPLEDEAPNTFTDVDKGGWYESAVLKCVAAGIIDGEGRTELLPWVQQTREQVFVMLARAFRVEPSESETLLRTYNDWRNVTEASRPYVEAMLEKGVASGRNAAQLFPQENLTRAELAALLDKLQTLGYIHFE